MGSYEAVEQSTLMLCFWGCSSSQGYLQSCHLRSQRWVQQLSFMCPHPHPTPHSLSILYSPSCFCYTILHYCNYSQRILMINCDITSRQASKHTNCTHCVHICCSMLDWKTYNIQWKQSAGTLHCQYWWTGNAITSIACIYKLWEQQPVHT